MSKTKASGAAHYEILFIIPNKFTEDETKLVIEKIKKVISVNDGQITHNEYWGKKKLAYSINHDNYGYYGLFEFDLEGKNLAKINKDLRLSTDVLRHQIVKKKLKTNAEIVREEKIREKIDSKKAEARKKEEEIEASKKSPDKSTSSGKTKVDLKDLDQKLEGILNANDLI